VSRAGTVTDRDYGWKALQRRLNRLGIDQGPRLRVGIFGEKAAAQHQPEDGGQASGLTVGEIAEIHELGLGNNPVRSWLRGTVDEHRSEIVRDIRRIAINVEKDLITPEAGFNLLGLKLVGLIQKRWAAGIPPQVTAATQLRKGPTKTTPLINSGQTRGSVSHTVES